MGSSYASPDISAVLFESARQPEMADWLAARDRIGLDVCIAGCEWRASFEPVDGTICSIPFRFQARVADARDNAEWGVAFSNEHGNDYRVAEFRLQNGHGGGFNFDALCAVQAIYAVAVEGLVYDEDYGRQFSLDSFVSEVQRQQRSIALDMAFLKAGAAGLPLEQIRDLDPEWVTPEESKARGYYSEYLPVIGDESDMYKLRKGNRELRLKELANLGFRID
ncbi:MAG: hypothetical protein AAGB48_11405 [Planctomycetota bacterium]